MADEQYNIGNPDMKMLITGIAGFIGYHTALRLRELGHEVFGFDNMNSYYDPELKWQRAANLKEHDIDFRTGDLENPERMREIVN